MRQPKRTGGSPPGSAGEHLLQARYGTAERADKFYDEQVLDYLNPEMREFVHQREMMFISTADAYGECDCSLRAGPPGFVRILDGRTLAYPEYRGNGVMASLGNILENRHIGLLFVDFATYRVGLHVNGAAQIMPDVEMRKTHSELFAGEGDAPAAERWVVVSVVEAYIHCSKHIPRLVEPSRQEGTADTPDTVDTAARGSANGVKRNVGDFFGTKARKRRQVREGRP